MPKPLEKLQDYTGQYRGEGRNHDGEPFKGELEMESVIDGKGVSIRFQATGGEGTVFHTEETVIAPTEDGNWGLWTLNSNMPYLYQHTYEPSEPVEGAIHTFKFLHNRPDDSKVFREEIAIDLWPDGDVSYRYSWGRPGGEYKERSGLKLKKR